jgi:hypothetical protein
MHRSDEQNLCFWQDAIQKKQMLLVRWKKSLLRSETDAEIYPLELFNHKNRSYIIWTSDHESQLECTPLMMIANASLLSKNYTVIQSTDSLSIFKKDWLYFEEHDQEEKHPTHERIVIKLHTPILLANLFPLQKIWKKFVIIGTESNELIIAGTGSLNVQLFKILRSMKINLSFLNPINANKLYKKSKEH